MLLGCDIVGSVVRRKWCAELRYHLTAVAYVTDVVNGHTRLGFSRFLDGFMNMMTPHALAAILGKQGRVEVDHTTVVCLDQIIGNHHQEPCQYDEMNVVLLEQWHHDFLLL